jgi:GTP-binding protein HflX
VWGRCGARRSKDWSSPEARRSRTTWPPTKGAESAMRARAASAGLRVPMRARLRPRAFPARGVHLAAHATQRSRFGSAFAAPRPAPRIVIAKKRRIYMYKLTSKPIAEHAEAPLADEGRWEALVSAWVAREKRTEHAQGEGNADYVVSVGAERDATARQSQLAEITSLVRHQGDRVVGSEIRHVATPNPRSFLGKGAAKEIADRARAAQATMLVLDAELSPSQTRNLEDEAGLPICDREAVILNVFLKHARTRRARIQVEMAQLQYLRPRIRGVGIDMDQQTGATKNARGPGETASELLARKLDGRLEQLAEALRRIGTASSTQRRRREACKRMVLVGYTNAGKTSLMNALSATALTARDMPFETLDTTSRCLTRHGGDVLLSDTVGFIRRLPERLLGSFESTLSEITDASLVVVVVDVADPECALHLSTTHELLERLGAVAIPRFYVFNKVDRREGALNDRTGDEWAEGHPWMVLSAHDLPAVARLKDALLAAAHRNDAARSFFVPYASMYAASRIYASCRVLRSEAGPGGLRLTVQGSEDVLARVAHDLREAK